jgi:hypothetical protein
MNGPCSHLHFRYWCEKRPSSEGDLHLSDKVEDGRVFYTGVDLLLISFLYRSRVCCWVAF